MRGGHYSGERCLSAVQQRFKYEPDHNDSKQSPLEGVLRRNQRIRLEDTNVIEIGCVAKIRNANEAKESVG